MSEKQAPPPRLAAKIAEIIRAVHHVEKRGRNEFHEYDYATAADVLQAVRVEMANRNVIVVPRVTGMAVVEKQRQGKSPEYITTADMVLTVMDGDSDEVWECPWKGCGQDSGDKGIYKGLTGGYKYFLLQLFMIPTGDDPERDTRKRKDQREQKSGPVDADAAAILVVAAELAQLRGTLDPGDVIEAYSEFKGRDGKRQAFRDPTVVKSEKWKKGVRARMESDLAKEQAKAEPGVQEAADLFADAPSR